MQQSFTTLFSPFRLGSIELKNRIVMAPMTRCRAIDNLANDLMAAYYADRATAGLLITEGVAPSPNGLGYARIPGIYSTEQTESWKKVTTAVHAKGGRIFMQLMHTGRISHPLNMPAGAEVVGASPIAAPTTSMWTDQQQLQPLPVPRELSTTEIKSVIDEFVNSAKNAIAAGFDGIEIHAANGYLPNQFLSAGSNQRTDAYGGSPENRNRFVLELAEAISAAIGADKTGIRLSPFGKFNDIVDDDTAEDQYRSLLAGLKRVGLVYVHFVNFGIPEQALASFTTAFGGTVILNGGYTPARAEADLEAGKAQLISFGSPFIANPDLVIRFREGVELAPADQATFYTADAKGYTDYAVATA